jgi:hypothetical protein
MTTTEPEHKNGTESIKVKTIIDKLKEFGYRVKVTHSRWFGSRLLKNSDIKCLIKATRIMEGDVQAVAGMIYNRGGETCVEASKDGNHYSSLAVCSLQDPFNYGTAGRLALFRVLKDLPEPELNTDLAEEIKKSNIKFWVQEFWDDRWVDLGLYNSMEEADLARGSSGSLNESHVCEVMT